MAFATLATGLMLNQDNLQRCLRQIPQPAHCPLGTAGGAVLGDMVRYLISVAITIAFGMVLGFR